MIPFPFAYLIPDSLDEAVQAYTSYTQNGKSALFYAGGTEIITKGRVDSIHFDAVIDLKNIKDMSGLYEEGDSLHIGAAQTLNDIACWNRYPLLTKCCQRVADHTAQCKITLGGNIAGSVIYHEAALALILADAMVVLYGPDGRREASLKTLYNPKLALHAGEMMVQFILNKRFAQMDYVHVKHVESEKIGYPLFTLAALIHKDKVSVAVSGIYAHPIWADFTLDDCVMSRDELVGKFSKFACGEVINDTMASGEYRLFRFHQALGDTLGKLKA